MSENNPYPMHVGIVVTSAGQLASVYALLGGAATLPQSGKSGAVSQGIEQPSAGPAISAQESPVSAGNGDSATNGASPSDGSEVDAHGWPWASDMHASTRTMTKEGLWRMKVGVTRPDPKPGFPIADAGSTSTASTGETASSQTEDAASANAGDSDDDEFAAFRAASEKVEAEDTAAAASIPARKWTDADLGALCNQAAVKLGDPAPVKALIAEYVTPGEVPHSRNIAEDKRAAFAAAVEAKAGIAFAG